MLVSEHPLQICGAVSLYKYVLLLSPFPFLHEKYHTMCFSSWFSSPNDISQSPFCIKNDKDLFIAVCILWGRG
jgi:hypothetical protein